MKKNMFEWKWRIAKAGLTQKEFCSKYGFAQGTFSNWIRGTRPITQKSKDRVEAALKELGV